MGWASTSNHTRTLRHLRIEAIRKYGGCCVRCGYSDWRALHFDHVNSGGYQDIENRKSCGMNLQMALLREILNDVSGKFQLLCSNCNWIKKYETGERAKQDLNALYLKSMPKQHVEIPRSIW